jgi:hypothetical protein
VVGGGDGSASQPVAGRRVGRQRSAETLDVDIRHGNDDRVLLRRTLRHVVEGQHRFLVELTAQCLGGDVQGGLVGAAQMKFTRTLKGDPLQRVGPVHPVERGRSRHRDAVEGDRHVSLRLEQGIGVVGDEELRRLTVPDLAFGRCCRSDDATKKHQEPQQHRPHKAASHVS